MYTFMTWFQPRRAYYLCATAFTGGASAGFGAIFLSTIHSSGRRRTVGGGGVGGDVIAFPTVNHRGQQHHNHHQQAEDQPVLAAFHLTVTVARFGDGRRSRALASPASSSGCLIVDLGPFLVRQTWGCGFVSLAAVPSFGNDRSGNCVRVRGLLGLFGSARPRVQVWFVASNCRGFVTCEVRDLLSWSRGGCSPLVLGGFGLGTAIVIGILLWSEYSDWLRIMAFDPAWETGDMNPPLTVNKLGMNLVTNSNAGSTKFIKSFGTAGVDVEAVYNKGQLDSEQTVLNRKEERMALCQFSLIARSVLLKVLIIQWLSAGDELEDDDYVNDFGEDEWPSLQGEGSSKPSNEFDDIPYTGQQSNTMVMVPFESSGALTATQ
ncbi:hypothetical protein FNV43_RR19821 [Rhamnella rubrinervis]|uniref:Uncharacterized protein n=1 Tax=Rhamnella rubrinervis TaxID=2594499 RepID=A0A8K0GU14_9ROSA|nr:hypothetical protein FNV43_RR19821 [Rhamnella rubrinervis]